MQIDYTVLFGHRDFLVEAFNQSNVQIKDIYFDYARGAIRLAIDIPINTSVSKLGQVWKLYTGYCDKSILYCQVVGSEFLYMIEPWISKNNKLYSPLMWYA